MDKAYEINHNLDHIRANEDYDVWHVIQNLNEKFDDLFLRLEPFDELPPHRFEGKLEKRLSWLDYPRECFGYPIVSKKMAEVLGRVIN